MGESASTFGTYWPQVSALNLNKVVPSGPFPFEKRKHGQITIGHAWYLYDGGEELFRETTRMVETHLLDLIRTVETEHHLAPCQRILVGHSMGAYFGFQVALRNPGFFSHMAGVSGNLKDTFLQKGFADGVKTKFLVVHGERDSSVPVGFAKGTHQTLRDHGFSSRLTILPGGHGIHRDRDATVAEWLTQELDLSTSRD